MRMIFGGQEKDLNDTAAKAQTPTFIASASVVQR
jgi:hypothetical protein